MPTVTLTSGIYSGAGEIASRLASEKGLRIYSDADIMAAAASRYDANPETVEKVVSGQPVRFNKFTHEREICIAKLRAVMASAMAAESCLFKGFLGHLIPADFSPVTRILVTGDRAIRLENAANLRGIPANEAGRVMAEEERAALGWTQSLFEKQPWDPALYDRVVPVDDRDYAAAAKRIGEAMASAAGPGPEEERRALADFELSAAVEMAVSRKGGGLIVSAENGAVTLTIDRNVGMLSKFKEEITDIAWGTPGVKSVNTWIGKNFYRTPAETVLEFEEPASVLLVDGEEEFVRTLSERLRMRDVGTRVAVTGREALDCARKGDADVMLLALKLPGMDGCEVLKQIKATKPAMEVIILTGYGSDEDRKRCMDMGAFAYLNKPADIDLITQTMKRAYEKINRRKGRGNPAV